MLAIALITLALGAVRGAPAVRRLRDRAQRRERDQDPRVGAAARMGSMSDEQLAHDNLAKLRPHMQFGDAMYLLKVMHV